MKKKSKTIKAWAIVNQKGNIIFPTWLSGDDQRGHIYLIKKTAKNVIGFKVVPIEIKIL